jgi:hypothetical protein
LIDDFNFTLERALKNLVSSDRVTGRNFEEDMPVSNFGKTINKVGFNSTMN